MPSAAQPLLTPWEEKVKDFCATLQASRNVGIKKGTLSDSSAIFLTNSLRYLAACIIRDGVKPCTIYNFVVQENLLTQNLGALSFVSSLAHDAYVNFHRLIYATAGGGASFTNDMAQYFEKIIDYRKDSRVKLRKSVFGLPHSLTLIGQILIEVYKRPNPTQYLTMCREANVPALFKTDPNNQYSQKYPKVYLGSGQEGCVYLARVLGCFTNQPLQYFLKPDAYIAYKTPKSGYITSNKAPLVQGENFLPIQKGYIHPNQHDRQVKCFTQLMPTIPSVVGNITGSFNKLVEKHSAHVNTPVLFLALWSQISFLFWMVHEEGRCVKDFTLDNLGIQKVSNTTGQISFDLIFIDPFPGDTYQNCVGNFHHMIRINKNNTECSYPSFFSDIITFMMHFLDSAAQVLNGECLTKLKEEFNKYNTEAEDLCKLYEPTNHVLSNGRLKKIGCVKSFDKKSPKTPYAVVFEKIHETLLNEFKIQYSSQASRSFGAIDSPSQVAKNVLSWALGFHIQQAQEQAKIDFMSKPKFYQASLRAMFQDVLSQDQSVDIKTQQSIFTWLDSQLSCFSTIEDLSALGRDLQGLLKNFLSNLAALRCPDVLAARLVSAVFAVLDGHGNETIDGFLKGPRHALLAPSQINRNFFRMFFLREEYKNVGIATLQVFVLQSQKYGFDWNVALASGISALHAFVSRCLYINNPQRIDIFLMLLHHLGHQAWAALNQPDNQDQSPLDKLRSVFMAQTLPTPQEQLAHNHVICQIWEERLTKTVHIYPQEPNIVDVISDLLAPLRLNAPLNQLANPNLPPFAG